MNTNIFKNIKQLLLLTVSMVITWIIVSGILQRVLGMSSGKNEGHKEAVIALGYLFLLCCLNSIIIIWYTKRSIFSGKKLLLSVFTIVFGVMFFMTQIETIYFNYAIKMPGQLIFSTLFTGAVVSIVASIVSVKIKEQSNKFKNRIPKYESQKLPLNIFILALIYLIFYFIFGYFIAWQFPLLREYYTGSQKILPFILHMKNQLSTDPWLVLFQIVRGVLWALIGCLAVRSVDVKTGIEKYLLVGFILSVGLCTPLLLPNDFMPSPVRFGHFFELLIENFLFGTVSVYFLGKEHNNTYKQIFYTSKHLT